MHAIEYMDPEPSDAEVTELAGQVRRRLIERAEQRLRALLAAEPRTWCAIEEVVVVNRAYRELLTRAAAGLDLIVMGAHGSSGLELMIFGSNTQHVVRAAPCPVLTVRATSAEP